MWRPGCDAGQSDVRIPVKSRDYFLLQNVQSALTHAVSYAVSTGVLYRLKSGRSDKLTIHLYVVLRLRMSGALPPNPLYTYMAQTGNNFADICKSACKYCWEYLRDLNVKPGGTCTALY